MISAPTGIPTPARCGKRIGFLCSAIVLAAICVTPIAWADQEPRGASFPKPKVPEVSKPHRLFLTRLARRTMRDALLGRPVYEPEYVPAGLRSLTAEVIVRLRQGGYLTGAGVGGPGKVSQATRDAAFACLQNLTGTPGVDAASLNKLLLEIEVVGPAEVIDVQADWTQWRAVDPFIEPGVHGMILVGGRGNQRFCPTEIVAGNRVLAEVLQDLAKTIHSDPSQLANTGLMRFRTVHWYQKERDAEPISLHRGLTVLEPDAVTRAALDDSIQKIADYMVYRQLESGLFTYEYRPGSDSYSSEDNIVRQVGALAAMSMHARWSKRSASRAAADLGIRHHLQGLVEIPDVEHAAFIATPDKRNKLGVTALLALALAEHPEPQRYEETRTKLVNGMLWLQRPSGMFITAFPPALQINAQDYFPGEALLATASHYAHRPTAEVLEAFDRAINYYRGYYRDTGSPAFVPWQVQAYAIMSRQTKRADYRNFVFELTDSLTEKQLTPQNCQWPEMWGGIASYQRGRAGVATAAYLEGFADALRLAQTLGQTERATRYEKVVRSAARFVMQLQVRSEEAYFIRSPQDAVGGIRAAPALNLLRIDHCQHALVALIKARQALYPDGD